MPIVRTSIKQDMKCICIQFNFHVHTSVLYFVQEQFFYYSFKESGSCVLITVQQDATQSSLFIFCKFTLHVSGVNHTHHQQYTKASLATLEGGNGTVLETAVTVLCTPDDGCVWHPKHVEWTCRIINRLLCVASHWTIINIDQWYTEP